MDPNRKPDVFGKEGEPQHAEDLDCMRWEAALVDLLDGTLSPEEAAAFTRHAESCEPCRVLLEETTRGRDWAKLLHEEPPVVPEALLGKILARTGPAAGPVSLSGEHALPLVVDGSAMPGGNVMAMPAPGWHVRGQREARVLMTAAMAFFSIGLTLSFSGFRPADLGSAIHAPSSIGAIASRHFFDTKKQVVAFYDNLRLVREMESTVQDLRQSADQQLDQIQKNKGVRKGTPTAQGDAADTPLLAHSDFVSQAEERTTL
ncbi:anti-sigma factor [Acidipila sp. EB88]|uniref:anti-sigma factor family protein n=1 Tax=Acidipila sp. EB88 TaxID=2305226 RepID=UPI000F5DEAA4|nr:anti-sigma factor [Acidipila sp. EB88]RRA48686.1 zf-HC2 domain-containing protein [Acidipila sp. EB88]